MRKIFLILAVFCSLAIVESANASFVSTLSFDGFFHYTSDGDLSSDDFFEGDFEFEENDFEYFGLGAFFYELDLDLPEDDIVIPWWLDVDVTIEGLYEDFFNEEETEIFEEFVGSIDLGDFSLTADDVGDIPEILATLFDSIGFGFEFDGDFESGSFAVFTTENILGFEEEALWLDFYGEAVLTGHTENVVPEPMSLMLMGSGLVGAFGVRRRKKKQS